MTLYYIFRFIVSTHVEVKQHKIDVYSFSVAFYVYWLSKSYKTSFSCDDAHRGQRAESGPGWR